MSEFGQYGDGGFDQGDTSFSHDQSSQRQALRTSLTPVTIKQINDSTQPIPDAEFQIHGVSLNMVSFVGVLRRIENTTSAIVLTIEDGTGSLDVRRWIDENNSTAGEETAKFNLLKDKYVIVTGALRDFNQKKNVQHATVSEVTDHNQIIYHNLSAINVHIKSQGITAKPKTNDDLFVSEDASVEDKVYTIITENTPTMPDGVPIQLIAQKLSISDAQASSICFSLVETGRIYSAYDDQAFLSV
jgi:replication factor A2